LFDLAFIILILPHLEVFLRRLIPNFDSPVIGMTHLAVMVFFAGLIAYFNAVTLMRWRTSRRALPMSREVAQ
jgi:uncharacterized membrane protein